MVQFQHDAHFNCVSLLSQRKARVAFPPSCVCPLGVREVSQKDCRTGGQKPRPEGGYRDSWAGGSADCQSLNVP